MAGGVGVWTGFSADPRLPESAGLKASDADRDHAADVLREAFADGRLTRDEHDSRLDAVLGTRLIGDFVEILADLAPTVVVRAPSAIRQDIRAAATARYERDLGDARNGWILVTTVCLAIWGATSLVSGGLLFFWPVFPSIGVGIGYVATRLQSEQRIEAIEDKLVAERRARRARQDRLRDAD